MEFEALTIGKPDDAKGRTFTTHLVAYILSDLLLPAASGGALRPVLLAYAGTPGTVRAFTANLRAGLVARTARHRFELLRSAGYRYQILQQPSRSLVLAYLPHLFHLHPGVQGEDALSFLNASPRWWLDRQEETLRPTYGDLARDVAAAISFVARLDTRSPLPIANDPLFHHALYTRALEEPWVLSTDATADFDHRGLDALGLESPVLCHVPHKTFEPFLARVTAAHLPRHLRRAPVIPLRPPTLSVEVPLAQLSLFG